MSNDKRPTQERDPAASMSLLTQFLLNPLDVGYSAQKSQAKDSRAFHRILVFLTSIALGLAGTAAVTSLRSPSRVDVVGSLSDQARQQVELIASIDEEVSELQSTIAAASGKVLEDAATSDLSTQLLTASSTITGKGVTITLKETKAVGLDADRSAVGRVRDHDLRMIVNALWAQGAEAISVNGMRIGPGSFIRTAGQSVIVNITPIQAPYVIEAIGDPQFLQLALIKGETGDYLSTVQSLHGVTVGIQTSQKLTLPPVEQRLLRYTTQQERTS